MFCLLQTGERGWRPAYKLGSRRRLWLACGTHLRFREEKLSQPLRQAPVRGLPALYKGEALLAAFLRESTSLPSPFALASEASCQQHFGSTLLLPEQEGGRAASPRARSGLAFPSTRGRNPAPCGVSGSGPKRFLELFASSGWTCCCARRNELDNTRAAWEQRARQRPCLACTKQRARPSSWGADFFAGRCASREQLKFHSPEPLSRPSAVPCSPRATCLPAGGHLKTLSCKLVPAG